MKFWQWLITALNKLLKPQPAPPLPPDPSPPPSINTIFEEINRARAANGRQAYKHSSCLSEQATAWAQSMARSGVLSHAGMQSRLSACGIQAGGEVVAGGQQTPHEAVDAWMHSPGHRALLLADYEVCGAGSSGVYWSANMGDANRFAMPSQIDPKERR